MNARIFYQRWKYLVLYTDHVLGSQAPSWSILIITAFPLTKYKIPFLCGHRRLSCATILCKHYIYYKIADIFVLCCICSVIFVQIVFAASGWSSWLGRWLLFHNFCATNCQCSPPSRENLKHTKQSLIFEDIHHTYHNAQFQIYSIEF